MKSLATINGCRLDGNSILARFSRQDNIISLVSTPLVSEAPNKILKFPIDFEKEAIIQGTSNPITSLAIYESYAEFFKRYEIIKGLVPDNIQDYTKWSFVKPFRLDGRGGLDVPIITQCDVRCKEVKTAYAVGLPLFDGTFSDPFLGSEYIEGWDDSANVKTNLKNISIPVRFEVGDSTEYSTYYAEPIESSDWEEGASEVTTHLSFRFYAVSFYIQRVWLEIQDVGTIDGRRVRLKRTTSKSRVDLPVVVF